MTETKLDQIKKEDVNLSEENTPSVLHGYAKVLESLVTQTITSGYKPKPSKKKHVSQADRTKKIRDWEKRKASNRDFALHSHLLHHFCDVYNISIEKVRSAILLANK